MAAIDVYLQQILDAVYGEEVRGSIHDSIAAMNVESSAAVLAATTARDSAKNYASAASSSETNAKNYAAAAAASAEEAAQTMTKAITYRSAITFSQLNSVEKKFGYMYNITDSFTADNRFRAEDRGKSFDPGANIIYDSNNLWEVSGGNLTMSPFTGTDGTTNGVRGLVPAPSTTDKGKYLNANGTWEVADVFPLGGYEGQVLSKKSDKDKDIFWGGGVYYFQDEAEAEEAIKRGIIGDGAIIVTPGGVIDYSGGGSVTITIDSSLSTTSLNPVQNRIITTEINSIKNSVLLKDGSVTADYLTIGRRTGTVGTNSFAQGASINASGGYSHGEGYSTTASGGYSHAEGQGSKSTGSASHAEGWSTTASGANSHAEGRSTTASGNQSHAGGLGTVAGYVAQTAVGKYNNNKNDTLLEIGNGASNTARSNAFEVTDDGYIRTKGQNAKIAFGVDTNGNYGFFKEGADTVTPFKNPTGKKTDTYKTNGTFGVDVTDYATHEITIDINDTPSLQSKTISPTTSKQTVTADSSYYGLSQVIVNAIETETKSITPTTSSQDVTPTSGKYLTKVTVGAIPNQKTDSGNVSLSPGNTKSYPAGYYLNAHGATASAVNTTTATATPTTSIQTLTPSSGYYYSKVTVNAIPNQRTASSETITAAKTYQAGWYPSAWTVTPSGGGSISFGNILNWGIKTGEVKINQNIIERVSGFGTVGKKYLISVIHGFYNSDYMEHGNFDDVTFTTSGVTIVTKSALGLILVNVTSSSHYVEITAPNHSDSIIDKHFLIGDIIEIT